MHMKITVEYHFKLTRMVIIKKKKKERIRNVDKNKNMNLCTITGGSVKFCNH